MSKSTVVRTWLAGVISLAAGLVVPGLSVGLMLGFGGTFAPAATGQGYDFVPTINGFFWTTIGGIVFGSFLAAIGGLVQLVAWIGAVLNTYRLQEKTWFAILLAGGLIGFAFGLVGLAVMVAYLIAGPDGMAAQQTSPRIWTEPNTLAPTT